MKQRSVRDSFNPGARDFVGDHWGPRPAAAERPPILLISNDATLGENLRCAAAQSGRAVVQVDGAAEALRQMRAALPAIVLLDLDLPRGGAWDAADCLLLEEGCPPLILLTARCGEFDLGSAIRAGSLIDKNTTANRLLDVVDQALARSCTARAEQNAIQRIMIRWLKPSRWSVPVTPAHRFWGINE